MEVSKKIMKKEGVKVQNIRFVDHDVAYGVQLDMTKEGADFQS